MTALSTFVLSGVILSHDAFFATVEFQLNPPVNGGSSLAVMPITAIPCEVTVGRKIYVVKNELEETPTITCEKMTGGAS